MKMAIPERSDQRGEELIRVKASPQLGRGWCPTQKEKSLDENRTGTPSVPRPGWATMLGRIW